MQPIDIIGIMIRDDDPRHRRRYGRLWGIGEVGSERLARLPLWLRLGVEEPGALLGLALGDAVSTGKRLHAWLRRPEDVGYPARHRFA
jgi:hypothetical protein